MTQPPTRPTLKNRTPSPEDAPELPWVWLGRRAYAEVFGAQLIHRRAIIDGEATEVIWLLEHPPVITVGRRPAPGTPSADDLAARGVAFHRSNRGGLATWHGPGQLVAYVMVDAWTRGLGARGLVAALEQGVMDYLASLGLQSGRRSGYPGVWVEGDKVCAIGLHLRRGVSMHGLALNLQPDLAGFDHIVPCGITDASPTSVERLLGTAPAPEQAAPDLAKFLQAAIRP